MKFVAAFLVLSLLTVVTPAWAQEACPGGLGCGSPSPTPAAPGQPAQGNSNSSSSVGDAFVPAGSTQGSSPRFGQANVPSRTPSPEGTGMTAAATPQNATSLALASLLSQSSKQGQYDAQLRKFAAANVAGVPKTIATDPAAAVEAQIIRDYAAYGTRDVDVQAVLGTLLDIMKSDQAGDRALKAQMLEALQKYTPDDAVKGGQIMADYLAKQQKLIEQMQGEAQLRYDAAINAANQQMIAAIVSTTSQISMAGAPAATAAEPSMAASMQQLAAFGAAGGSSVDKEAVMALALASVLEDQSRQQQVYEKALGEAAASGAAGVPKSIASDPVGALKAQIAQLYSKYGAKDADVQSAIGEMLKTVASNPGSSSTELSQQLAAAMANYTPADVALAGQITADYLNKQQQQLQEQMAQADAKSDRQLTEAKAHVQQVKAGIQKLAAQMSQTSQAASN